MDLKKQNCFDCLKIQSIIYLFGENHVFLPVKTICFQNKNNNNNNILTDDECYQ